MINSDLLKKQFLATLEEMFVPFVDTDVEKDISFDFLAKQFSMYVHFCPSLMREPLVIDFISTAMCYGYSMTLDNIMWNSFNSSLG